MSLDPAYSMFISDAPQEASAEPVQVSTAAAQAKPQQSEADPSASLFPTEKTPDPAASVGSTFETWASAAFLSGNSLLADEIRGAAGALADDFRNTGMPSEEVQTIMDLTREHQANTAFGPVSEQRLAVERERAIEHLVEAGVNDAELSLAHRFVSDLDRKMGGKVNQWLIATGQGNDPRTIQRAISEAKRRGYR